MKRLVQWVVLVTLPALFAVLCVVGYYAWGKISYAGYSCGSFAAMDDQIGWVLAPDATSRLGGRAPFGAGPPWFHSTAHTDANGFRAAAPGGDTPTGGILAVGDSWTFGFGVDHADAYPAQLATQSGMPVVTVASPAYSSAQALLLAERWAPRPRAIVYLDNGFRNRAACAGRRQPETILKPCYWQALGAAEAELVLPPPGRVTRASAMGIQPGGVLGAGEMGWSYFLWARPLALAHQTLVRLGVATAAGVPVVMLDPGDIYADLMDRLAPAEAALIHRIGGAEWNRAVAEPTSTRPPEQAHVPHDGHYGPGMNKLIAGLVTDTLRSRGIGG